MFIRVFKSLIVNAEEIESVGFSEKDKLIRVKMRCGSWHEQTPSSYDEFVSLCDDLERLEE